MVAAVGLNPNIQSITQDNLTANSSSSMSLENLVEPTSVHASDISNFHATVMNSVQQSASVSHVGSSSSSGGLFSAVANMVDGIQGDFRKIANFAENSANLSPQDLTELQRATESFSLGSQLLAKGVSLTTKAIDTLVHMQ